MRASRDKLRLCQKKQRNREMVPRQPTCWPGVQAHVTQIRLGMARSYLMFLTDYNLAGCGSFSYVDEAHSTRGYAEREEGMQSKSLVVVHECKGLDAALLLLHGSPRAARMHWQRTVPTLTLLKTNAPVIVLGTRPRNCVSALLKPSYFPE
jgi:hypothetical protein